MALMITNCVQWFGGVLHIITNLGLDQGEKMCWIDGATSCEVGPKITKLWLFRECSWNKKFRMDTRKLSQNLVGGIFHWLAFTKRFCFVTVEFRPLAVSQVIGIYRTWAFTKQPRFVIFSTTHCFVKILSPKQVTSFHSLAHDWESPSASRLYIVFIYHVCGVFAETETLKWMESWSKSALN